MNNTSIGSVEIAHFGELFKAIGSVTENFTNDLAKLIRYTQFPIETEVELLERAEVMDELMDMSNNEADIAMVFASAISDRIEDF